MDPGANSHRLLFFLDSRELRRRSGSLEIISAQQDQDWRPDDNCGLPRNMQSVFHLELRPLEPLRC